MKQHRNLYAALAAVHLLTAALLLDEGVFAHADCEAVMALIYAALASRSRDAAT